MRGLTKVAALLSSALAHGFVLPESTGNQPSLWPGRVIRHLASEATLDFSIDDFETDGKHPILELHVSGVSQPCGESDVRINGQQLDVQWDGIEGHGNGFLDVFPSAEASWSVICLYDSVPSDGSFSNGQDVIHLLRVHFSKGLPGDSRGFTISYKQMITPSIVRFSPNTITFDQVDDVASKWRSPSLPSESEDSHLIMATDEHNHHQKGLGSSLHDFGSAIKDKVGKALKKIGSCLTKPTNSHPIKVEDVEDIIGNEKPEETATTPESSSTSNTVSSFSAAETRSLHTIDEPSSSTSISSPPSAPNQQAKHKPFQILGLSLIILSLLIWLYRFHTDPRRRADRAARREERQTKRLYRRAARRQKIKTWLWNFRMKYRLAPKETLDSNEKGFRVVEQENVLENVMKDDIRALRNAHRVVSSMTAAEEGINYFEYEAGSSSRRRSVATLPGYESEGSQPPSYDVSGAYIRSTAVFAPAENDSDPDSSVVSTSPRISRDGTNSDFDEKFETISLEPRVMAGDYNSNNRV